MKCGDLRRAALRPLHSRDKVGSVAGHLHELDAVGCLGVGVEASPSAAMGFFEPRKIKDRRGRRSEVRCQAAIRSFAIASSHAFWTAMAKAIGAQVLG